MFLVLPNFIKRLEWNERMTDIGYLFNVIRLKLGSFDSLQIYTSSSNKVFDITHPIDLIFYSTYNEIYLYFKFIDTT